MFVRRWLEALVERLTARRLPVRRVFARGLGSSTGSRPWVVAPHGAWPSQDLWSAIERLEVRNLLAATLTASLDGGGNLVIQETTGAVNALTLQLNVAADSVEITDASEQFASSAIAGATLSNSDKSMTVLRTSINGASFGIQATGGDDALADNGTADNGTADNTRATVAATLTVGSNHGSSTLSGVIQNTASKQQRVQGASR